VARTRAWSKGMVAGAVPLLFLWSCAGRSVGGGSLDSGPDSGSPDSGPVAQADFAERAVSAICGNIGGCCEKAGIGFDRAGCDAYVRAEADRDAPSPNTVWDSEAAGRCIDFYTDIATSCLVSEDQFDEHCDRVYRGTLPAGGECFDDFECADIGGERAICFHDGTTVNGRCKARNSPPPEHAGLGEACHTSCSDCGHLSPDISTGVCFLDEGMVCDFNINVCVPIAGLGEPCPAYVCVAGAYCDTLDLMCKAKKNDGASCEYGDQCSIGSCLDGVCSLRTVASVELCLGEN